MQFSVRALRGGELVCLALEATDAADAERQAQARGATVLSVTCATSWRERLTQRQQPFDLMLFSQEILALLDAGINVVEAIETLAQKDQRTESRAILDAVLGHLNEGQPLSTALQHLPEAFPALYVATVRASERTGNLGEGLGRYLAYAHQVDLVRKKLINASIYPVLLLATGGLVMLFLLTYVVPRFSRIYEDMGSNLPLLSRLLMHWGRFVESHGLLLLAGLAALAFTGYRAAASPTVRQALTARIWRLSVFGERFRIYQLARFYRTLGMLLRGGIPITTAIDMVSGLLQPTYRPHLAIAAEQIREGRSISVAFDANCLTTPVALRMLRVGERSGRMGEIMERIAAFYDDAIGRWVEWFTRLFEPVLMALIGLMIGLIVVLMYLPIFELAGGLR